MLNGSEWQILSQTAILMSRSNLHRKWYLDDLDRLIVTPIKLGQYVTHFVNDELVGFGSWALMAPESLDAFLTGSRKLTREDFSSGSIPVLVDIISPDGFGRQITSQMRDCLVRDGFKGQKIWYIRYYKSGRVAKGSII